MATHSSVLAWRIPGTGEPGGLPSPGLHRVGHDWRDSSSSSGSKTSYAWQQCVHFYSPSGSSSETQITWDETVISLDWASQVALVVKNLPANAGDISDVDSIPVSGRPPRGGHGNPLQYSCLENPTDRQTDSPRGCKELDSTEATKHTYSRLWSSNPWGRVWDLLKCIQ